MLFQEENRAYIQKVGWNLEKLPYVLPNKLYYLKSGEVQEDMLPVIEEMKREKRKKSFIWELSVQIEICNPLQKLSKE